MRRVVLALAAAVAVLLPATTALQAQTQPLSFFKNYFLTGDYAVNGVGLRGLGAGGQASGTIVFEADPPGVDVVAAFLYWQVVAPAGAPDAGATGATFRGHVLSGPEGPFAKTLGAMSAACTTGGSGSELRTFSYRADVLRFFDVDPATGKLAANGHHAVSLPAGAGLEPLGASLVVVYRDPQRPFNAIVIYDGAYASDAGGLNLTIDGFYDAGTTARLSHIAGNGRSGRAETLRYNGVPIATNAFASTAGPGWDNPGAFLTADPSLTQVTTSVDAADCLTWSAVVYRTAVKDGDGDGLLDRWESSATTIVDPFGRPLPNLAAMGASPFEKDVFIEIGYLKTDQPTSYGGVVTPAHSHLPSPDALKLVGDMFANAPTGRVNVHFDVGDQYPQGPADAYVIRGPGLARGGEAIDEAVTVCTPGAGAPVWECQFSAYPGTVGWKTGYRLLRDEVLNPPPGGDDACEVPGSTCERRFDETRRDMFRYALFAHALGLPKSELACLDAAGQPVDDVNGVCAVASNPAFHVPRTNTGVGDFPGGDVLVTLGGFADASGLPVGTPFMQAGTLAHEFGHTADRRHGGGPLEPNCKPTYFSVMNYLYQLRGLLDDAGTPHLDFSGGLNGQAVDETALADGSPAFMPYRLGYYAPLAGSYLAGHAPGALNHCDGSPLLTDASGHPTEPAMIRVDGRRAADGADWNADGDTTDTTPFGQDVNFNGRLDGAGNPPFAPLAGSDDWSALRYDQVGARRNVGGLYIDPATGRFAVGPLSLAVGKGDLGKGDLGKGDLGKGDLGKGDLGKGDLGKGDLGKGDLGKGDLGKGDLGGGDLFLADPNNPGGELDAETAGNLARTPPNQFMACVAGIGGCAAPSAGLHDVVTRWTMPNIGAVARYTVYRVDGAALAPGQTWTPVAQVPAVSGQIDYDAVDPADLVDGADYTYFVVATYADGVQSDPSNLVTLTGVNDPPAAFDIPDVTIGLNGTTGPIAFTIVDESPATVVLSASSSNPALAPAAVIVFGGSGAARTVTVTPSANRVGTAVITVTATDASGNATSDSFTLTVQEQRFTFVNVQNAPAPGTPAYKAGSAVPMKWAFARGTTLVPSGQLSHQVTVRGPLPNGPVRTITNTDPGSSSFRYSESQQTWTFNLQTKEDDGTPYPTGTYEITVTPSDPQYMPSTTFQVTLTGKP
ncbi:MAG: hypothetical protein AB7O93_15245 [Vicinamibacterales bacterium]